MFIAAAELLVLAWGKKPPPAPPPPPADTLLAAIVSVLAFWVLPLVLLRLKSDAAESSPTVLTPTAKGRQMLTERGWSTGWVVFGAAASESSVKLMTSVSLLKGKDFTHVDTSFDDMPLDTQPKMGVKSDAWREVSGGYGCTRRWACPRSSVPRLSPTEGLACCSRRDCELILLLRTRAGTAACPCWPSTACCMPTRTRSC